MKNYFTLSELLHTDTGLSNHPLDDVTYISLGRLKIVLNILRSLVACPIIVNSAFRTSEVNKAVCGVLNSRHLYGRAADITCKNMPKLLELCMQFHESGIFDECIYYPDKNFIHVAI